jgi:pyruvate dehydrogenase E1 component alpha subunit
MSDPAKYRTKEELEEYKTKDPIEHVLNVIKTQQFATEAEIETINDKVKAIIDDCVEFAENSPWPDDSEVYKDIYTDENYPYIMD